MKKSVIRIEDAPSRSMIAEDVFDKKGTFLLSKDTTLNTYILNKLSDYGIREITIYESKEVSSMDSKDQALGTNEFIACYNNRVDEMKGIMSGLVAGKKVDVPEFKEMANNVFSEMESYFSVVECLNELRTADDYTYAHSVNVSIYSMLMAKWLGLDDEQVKDITLAGLLHDIGKSRIPQKVVNKKGPLKPEEFAFMKKHSPLGFNMVRDVKDLKDEIKEVILMHHERKDGKGYPEGVMGDEISLYTRIVSIADVYDAMTSERVYKKRITPFDTFREFQLEGYESFDTKIMLTFLSNIATYYLGSPVRLNTGEIGEVVYLPPLNISRPVVQVGEDFIDLSKHRDRKIVEML